MTVDSLTPWRRRGEIDWALVQIATALRRHGEDIAVVPPSLLQRWLDTPQLLNSRGTKIALDLLSRQRPDMAARRYLHRAVAASSEGHAETLMGGLWRALVATEPAAVLAVASRWVAFGFRQNPLLELMLELLGEHARAEPALIDELDASLASTPDMSEHAIDVARNALNSLREQLNEERHK